MDRLHWYKINSLDCKDLFALVTILYASFVLVETILLLTKYVLHYDTNLPITTLPLTPPSHLGSQINFQVTNPILISSCLTIETRKDRYLLTYEIYGIKALKLYNLECVMYVVSAIFFLF